MLLGYSGLLMVENIIPEENRFFKIFLALSFLINPFYIQNLSYQFDSITMSLSVFTAVLSAIVITNNRNNSIIISILTLTSSCCFYQAGINIFPVVLIVSLVAKNDESAPRWEIFFKAILVFSVTVVLYKIISSFTTNHHYALRVQKTAPIDFYMYTYVLKSFQVFLSKMITLFTGNYGVSWGLTIAFSGLFYVYSLYKDYTHMSWSNFSFKVISALIVLFFCVGVLAIQVTPAQPSRVLIGYSGFIIFVVYWFLSFKKYSWVKYLLILPFFYSFSLMSSYSNILKGNEEFTNFIARSIASDLIEIGYTKKSSFIFINSQPDSEELKKIIKTFPHIYNVVPKYLKPNYIFGYVYMRRQGIHSDKILNKNTIDEIISELKNKNLKLLVHNLIYSIYNENDLYMIKFNHM
jgi:hypothetical protein